MLVVVGVVGGYLAVAHALGETYTRRRMALGVVIGSSNSYRYLLVGLVALASLWAAWALFGWVPVAGSIVWGAAFFISWLLGTAGFGAALLSRAGIKENFSGRLFPPEALTDEYLWATPSLAFPPDGGRAPALLREGCERAGSAGRSVASSGPALAQAQTMRPFSTFRQLHGETRLNAEGGVRRRQSSGRAGQAGRALPHEPLL